jgi:hypothetical protein
MHFQRVRNTVPVLAAALLFLTGCNDSITGVPLENRQGIPDEIAVGMTLVPDEVDPHGSFTAVFQLRNRSHRTVRITTPHSCLVVPGVYRGSERVPFQGSWYACLTVLTTHTFEPGESRTISWDMKAELYAQHQGDPDGAPAPPGPYVVRAEFEMYNEDGTRPGVGALLRVR